MPSRVWALNDDMDRADRVIDNFDKRLGKMQGILVGILISVTTAAILLALQLGVK